MLRYRLWLAWHRLVAAPLCHLHLRTCGECKAHEEVRMN